MQAVKLLVKSDYQSRDLVYRAGAVIEVPQDQADFLQRDAPGCFEPVKETPAAPKKALEAPPVDKMVRREDTEKK